MKAYLIITTLAAVAIMVATQHSMELTLAAAALWILLMMLLWILRRNMEVVSVVFLKQPPSRMNHLEWLQNQHLLEVPKPLQAWIALSSHAFARTWNKTNANKEILFLHQKTNPQKLLT